MDNFERIRSLKEYIKCLEKMVSEDIDLKIKQGLNLIFKKYNIKNKDDLDNWCGIEGRKKLYKKVRYLCPKHWNSIKNPESTVRARYEKILEGYKIFKI